ncbi:ABC-type dipeptide/oligopeptide/nickel transport system ATPase component [Microbacterium terrae]|uniref:Oligopeptide transport ATP-binding protein OppD n=1 Tax=Microbacterium terrae TaxID=69369 RepID=A0A0M2H471_9MICO|nr:ABC transporter ATP-binding protein [Microbacterium terrae]KJL38651.1 Oligopeptide transport ATP-binding protein OppD [Microbacterium terrae]MBP1076070.1 ABC-type dipeptide/oligopeptide/nickel transport system ATPase component [Microbacterium terrae]GLJ96890.1 ABC transporter ATP-binding protein [Microbacterium terrae]
MSTPLLEIDRLVLRATEPDGTERDLVHGLSLTVEEGEVLGLVGESGSGKTLTMLAAIGLLPPSVRIASGDIRLRGESLREATDAQLRSLRGRSVSMIFQDPLTALNPLRRVGTQLASSLRQHRPGLSRRGARALAVDLFENVGIRRPAEMARAYPHQWSGGMRQRAMIAMAVANDPALLIADEPTTALDVTVQAQVMRVLADARSKTGAGMILITHDLGLSGGVADRIAVMRDGRLLECGDVLDVYDRPAHPYTRALLAAAEVGRVPRGTASLTMPPRGASGPLVEISPGHLVAQGAPIG